MAVIERTYTIPLRKEWLKAPRYKRAKKAVAAVKKFLKKHLKVNREVKLGDIYKDIKLGKYLNLEIWSCGIRNPPSRIKVTVQKDDKGVVRAELFGKPIIVEKKEEVKKGLAEKIKEKVTGKEEKPKIIKEELKAGEAEETKHAEKKEAKHAEKKEVKFENKPAKQPKPVDAKKPAKQEIR